MSYFAIVVKPRIVNHPNADKLNLAHVLGTTVVVGKDMKDSELCVYFPSDGQLSEIFCEKNNLLRKKNEDGTVSGGLFELNRKIRTIKLRGEKSDGFIAPLSYFEFTGADLSKLKEGEQFTELNGIAICNKYETPQTIRAKKENKGKYQEPRIDRKLFPEHLDTSYLFRNLNKIEENSVIYLLPKKHGTSFRCGFVSVNKKLNIFEKLLKKCGVAIAGREYQFVVGSRRVIKELGDTKNSFHRKDLWHDASKALEGKLRKGEMVYGEIVGYEDVGKPIMGIYDNKKVGKDFVKQYGDKTVFKYGCADGEFQLWVYRIGYINEDGFLVDLPYESVKKRCVELGVNCSEELLKIDLSIHKEYYQDKRALLDLVNSYLDKPSVIDSSHVEEGVIIQVEGYPNPEFFKEKSFTYKVLEDMIKSDENFVDIEESN